MRVYAETSAVLAALFGESEGETVAGILDNAEATLTSMLTLAEVERAFCRLPEVAGPAAAKLAARRPDFLAASADWIVMPVSSEILFRCGHRFPVEPVRTLDAVHLGTIERVQQVVPDVVVVSTDRRVRTNAARLGLTVLPG
ncbi:MAG: PIN domain-containing protein [Deltaproteobacteria bacterium]|nr:PIN domain-containing protein [Deltaproteobacteria bacterium]